MLKPKDVLLLAALQENSRAGLKELSKAAGMPVSTVHDRLKQLEEEGVIKKYAVVLDAEKVGARATAFVLLTLRYLTAEGKPVATQKQVAEKIAKMPEVQEAHIITGEWDMLLKIRAGSTRELGDFVFDRLREIPGVDKTVTFESFHGIKEFGPINLSAGARSEAQQKRRV